MQCKHGSEVMDFDRYAKTEDTQSFPVCLMQGPQLHCQKVIQEKYNKLEHNISQIHTIHSYTPKDRSTVHTLTVKHLLLQPLTIHFALTITQRNEDKRSVLPSYYTESADSNLAVGWQVISWKIQCSLI